jgi:hypothetical protein
MNDSTCQPALRCDFASCQPRLADGTPCSQGNECLVGSTCLWHPTGYACAPLPVSGVPCDFDCAPALVCKGPSGACVNEVCGQP